LGGILVGFGVPDGPHRKAGQGMRPGAFLSVFQQRDFRAAAFGYFGHLWVLYAFWAFVPVMLTTYQLVHPAVSFNVPLLSFCVIGIGGLACVLGGYLSQFFGPYSVAFTALASSGVCCLLAPLVLAAAPFWLLLVFLLFWGMVVVMDSPQFSTLVAQNAAPAIKGTALTIVNCIGFAITILSIQLLGGLTSQGGRQWMYVLLGAGPCLGLLAFRRKTKVMP
ncbi:MAG: MFS transporter, partial [Bacteroidota bacterium]